jgi:hypothetical protein
MRHHLVQLFDAFLVGGDLRAQVGQVLVGLRAGYCALASSARVSSSSSGRRRPA